MALFRRIDNRPPSQRGGKVPFQDVFLSRHAKGVVSVQTLDDLWEDGLDVYDVRERQERDHFVKPTTYFPGTIVVGHREGGEHNTIHIYKTMKGVEEELEIGRRKDPYGEAPELNQHQADLVALCWRGFYLASGDVPQNNGRLLVQSIKPNSSTPVDTMDRLWNGAARINVRSLMRAWGRTGDAYNSLFVKVDYNLLPADEEARVQRIIGEEMPGSTRQQKEYLNDVFMRGQHPPSAEEAHRRRQVGMFAEAFALGMRMFQAQQRQGTSPATPSPSPRPRRP